MVAHAVSLFVLLLVGLASGEVVKTQKCYLPPDVQNSCKINEVRINPCPEAAENKPCRVKLGTNSSLSFDYTPTFSTSNVGSHVYKVNALLDTPFEEMDTNGCLYTKCPVEANKRQVYTYGIEVNKKYPADVYQIKWKLWNKDNHEKHMCCFKMSVQLVE